MKHNIRLDKHNLLNRRLYPQTIDYVVEGLSKPIIYLFEQNSIFV